MCSRPGASGPGLEMLAPVGTPVRAVFAGRVAFADRYDPFGQIVILDHGDHYYTLMGDLSSMTCASATISPRAPRSARSGDRGTRGLALYFEVRHGQSPSIPGRGSASRLRCLKAMNRANLLSACLVMARRCIDRNRYRAPVVAAALACTVAPRPPAYRPSPATFPAVTAAIPAATGAIPGASPRRARPAYGAPPGYAQDERWRIVPDADRAALRRRAADPEGYHLETRPRKGLVIAARLSSACPIFSLSR